MKRKIDLQTSHRTWLVFALLAIASLLAATPVGGTSTAAPDDLDQFTYLPLAMKSGCAPIAGQAYDSIAPTNPRSDNVENDYLINLARRGYEPVNKFKGLVTIGPVGDSNAPQFPYLFADRRTPAFRTVYALHKWDAGCNCPSQELVTNPEVTVAGLGTTPGEIIHVPNSGYDIGGGNDVMVLYASETRLTLKYTREDDIAAGYTVYLENVCTEPSLLAMYRSFNTTGRQVLPALKGGQPLGRAIGSEIGVAVRDAGQSRDPRSRNSWWIGR